MLYKDESTYASSRLKNRLSNGRVRRINAAQRQNLLISSGLKQRMIQNTLFSKCAPTANLTAKTQESRMLLLLITSTEPDVPWELRWRSKGSEALMKVPGGRLLVTFAVRLLSNKKYPQHEYAQVALQGT